MVPFFSSVAYMTNRTSHFKQLELLLAINHLDTSYCARNRATFKREESEGAMGAILSTLGEQTIVRQTQGIGHIVV